jgi:hypothetical protein
MYCIQDKSRKQYYLSIYYTQYFRSRSRLEKKEKLDVQCRERWLMGLPRVSPSFMCNCIDRVKVDRRIHMLSHHACMKNTKDSLKEVLKLGMERGMWLFKLGMARGMWLFEISEFLSVKMQMWLSESASDC